jgi:type I restriction enzyme S subunit
MKLEMFFEKFELFADAPDAVAKMRELVLELAVRGQLSERKTEDANDPAWRSFLAKFDNRIHGGDPGPPPPFEVPVEWRWVSLNALGTTKVRNDMEDSTPVSFVPMALISSTYGVPAQSEERSWGEIKKGFTHFADEDVVMAKISPCFENAKSAVMRNLINGVGAGTTELHVFRKTSEVILPDYVLLYIKTRGFITRGESKMTGSAGQKRVPRDYFADSPFPLPPLAEQKRIVAKVDELMALCDRLEAQQREREEQASKLARASLARFADAPTSANLSFLFHPFYAGTSADLRKSILTLAVQGKLTPSVETKHVVLSEVIELISGQHLLAHEHNEEGKGIPYLTGPSDFGPKHPVPTRWTETPKVVAEPGDILVTVKGSGVGKTNKLVSQQTAISRQLMAVRVTGADSDFVHLVLMNAADHFQESMTGIAIPGIGRKDVLELEAELPPLAEQRRIVAKVEQLMALVDALETQLAAARATAANLLSALVAELTGTPTSGKVSIPAATGTGLRGRPRKA